MTKKENTESKIVEAARDVFHKKGYDGARMQEIADTAQINKGLLHYYFKSKDKLFEKVFGIALNTMFRKVEETLNSDRPLLEKIETFCHNYISIVSKNSYLPRFVITELGKNPEKFMNKIVAKKGQPSVHVFALQVEKAIAAGEIRPTNPRHLIVNMISLCVFPFLAEPMIMLMTDMDKPAWKAFVAERKQEVTQFIVNSIKI